MNVAVLAGSLAAVLALAALAHLLGLGGDARLTEDAARALAYDHDFDAATIVLDDERRTALATDGQGNRLRIRRHGSHFVAEALDCNDG